jgi:hypothetical protein
MASFEIGADRIEHFNESGVLDVAVGTKIDVVDANKTATFGAWDESGTLVPTMKMRGSSGGDYVLARGASSGVLFEVSQNGTPVLKVEDSGGSDPSVFIDELTLKDLLIKGTLTMGSGGKIVNNPSGSTDYTINGNGFTLVAGDPNSGPLARRINWTENGTEIAKIAADNGTIESTVNGDEASGYSGMAWYGKEFSSSSGSNNRMKMGMDYRPDGGDHFEFLVSDSDGIYTNDYPEFEIGKMGTDDRGWRYYPNGGMMVWKNPRQSAPSDSYCKDLLDGGEFALYALDEDSSSTTGDVRLKYVERKPDGSISRKTIQD